MDDLGPSTLSSPPLMNSAYAGYAQSPAYGTGSYYSPSEEKSRKAKKAKKAPSSSEGGGGAFALESGILNGGVMGGMLAMIVAVVWFVAGLAGGIIFFYPPVLFVIGFIAFIKGLVSSSSS